MVYRRQICHWKCDGIGWQQSLGIDKLLKKTDLVPRMEILPEPSASPISNFRQTLIFVNTVDKTLSMTTESNKDAVTKEENKVDIIMDSLNDGVTETKIIDCLISNN